MGWVKVSVLLGALAFVAAAALAVYSRTPASIRDDVAPASATDPSLGASFTEDQVQRHGRFRSAGYLAFALATALPVVVLLLLARGPFRELADRVGGPWPLRAALLAIALVGVLAVVELPLTYVRGFAMQHAWGLSTQDVASWLSDQAKGLVISGVMASVSAVAFFGVVRLAPSTWWLWGWGAFTALTAALAFLYPVAIAPLFNDFTPLKNEALTERIQGLGRDAGVSIDEVLVVDASRRTTGENAYVAGLGATKQVVIYDTLLESGTEDETAFVVAHELGHRAEGHVLKGVMLSSLGLLIGFGVLKLLASTSVWSWSGASGVGDVRALPLLVLFFAIMSLFLLPVENTVSRRFEATADRIAISLTGDRETAVSTFRRLAFKNISDLDPPRPIVWALYTHPPTRERLQGFISVPANAANP